MKLPKLPKVPEKLTCRDMEDVNSVLLSLVAFDAFSKALDELTNECKDAIKAFMKEHEVTSVGTKETYASITQYTTSLFDKKSFEKEHPKMYGKYVITKSRERFTYGKKEEK